MTTHVLTETMRCVAGLAGCLHAMGKRDEAEAKYTDALEGFVRGCACACMETH